MGGMGHIFSTIERSIHWEWDSKLYNKITNKVQIIGEKGFQPIISYSFGGCIKHDLFFFGHIRP